MADIKNVLYEEIRRLARKEVKLAVAPLQAKIVELRQTISALSKKVKCAPSAPSAEVSKDSDENTDGKKSKSFRFKAAAIKKLRAKFDMSQAEFAKLVGVSTLTVSCWELGKTSPRPGAKERLAQLRSMGKREIAKMNKQTPKAPEEPAAPEEK